MACYRGVHRNLQENPTHRVFEAIGKRSQDSIPQIRPYDKEMAGASDSEPYHFILSEMVVDI